MSLLPAVYWSARPWSFTMTFVSVTIGSLVGARSTAFSWPLYLATLAGLTVAHAATNILNDVFDTRYGVDAPDSPTARYRRHPLLEGMTEPRRLLTAAIVLYAVALAVGGLLTVIRGWPILVLTLLGFLASVLYSGGPFRYKPRALGELSVFAMWGPLTVGGAAFVQSAGAANVAAAVLVSLPQGLWVALVIFANNLKDIGYDARVQVRTLASLLGRRRALAAFVVALAATYLLVIAETAGGTLGPWALLVLASLPAGARLVRTLLLAPEIPANADPRTAAVAMIFGALLIAALIIERIAGAPGIAG